MNKAWLRDWPWGTITAINSGLCKEKNALHKPTSEGHEPARKLWEDSRRTKMRLRQALEICRRCHKLSPFCFYNGNTFVAVGRTMIQDVAHGSGEPTSCATELARAFGVPGVIALFAAPIGVDLSFDGIALEGALEF